PRPLRPARFPAPERRDRDAPIPSPSRSRNLRVKPDANAILELNDVVKTYGTEKNPVPVLRGISLLVTEGEYVAIVGPSGSGKSTLLNILGCLDRPTGGSYRLAGDDVATMDDRSLSRIRNTRIGFVFQSFHLVSHLTVIENVEMPLFYARAPKRE